MMMFLVKWLRRINADTGAEWLATRFGNIGRGMQGSHNVVVAFALLSCFGFLAYGFIGLGKFIEIFIPWNMVQPLYSISCIAAMCAAFLRDCFYPFCHVLFYTGWHAQHCAWRFHQIHCNDGCLHFNCSYCCHSFAWPYACMCRMVGSTPFFGKTVGSKLVAHHSRCE